MKILILAILTLFVSCQTAYAGEIVLDSPKPVSVEAVVKYKIIYFEVDLKAMFLNVNYEGLDADDKAVESGTTSIEGAELGAMMFGMANGSKTIYDNLADLLYIKLKDKIGAVGTVQ